MGLFEQIADIFGDFADPKKRVFVGYLALSVIIALIWLIAIRRRQIGGAFRTVFDRKVFFSRSAIADYMLFVVNHLIFLVISPLLITQLAIATAIYHWLHEIEFLHSGYFRNASPTLVIALFSVTMFIVDDFTKYMVHRWMHRWPILWAIHKTHHSAETLTPVTVYRVHPLEGVVFALRSAVAQGVAIPVFIYLFGGIVDLYTVLGVNVLVFIFHVTGSNLRHSHISIRYWPWLERILISPAQHQLHHSIAEEHHDKNFGAALAVWDWLFGSLHLSEERTLTYGLDAEERSPATGLVGIYVRPVMEIATIVGRKAQAAANWTRSILRAKAQ
ncbi:MAG: sterol desaturase family protein [Pseudomonadota bacterium]